ncbi:glycoside hydrolase family 19 protein
MDRTAFFAALRRRTSGVFGTSLSQSQVDGINGILDAFATHGDGRDKTLAYALATAYHETGARMVPVREGFAKNDASARRIVAKRDYGKLAGKYGHVYYGRGQVQLTWLKNYDTSSADAAYDLVAYPDKMLDPVISARVMIKGLLDGRWNGAGKGIAAYLPASGPDDLKNARRTVNVTDKWELIGGYYAAFLSAIKEAGGVPVATPAPQPAPASIDPKPITIEPQPVTDGNWIGALIKAIAAVFTRKEA